MASCRPRLAVGVDPADIKVQPAPKQNSVRYFTDWALPQLDTLIDETSEPIDVFTTLDPAMQAAANRCDQRIYAGRGAGRAGGARPRRRGEGDDRRPRLCRFHLQPRDPGRAAAGLRLQAVRLSVRARIRDEARRHDRRRAGDDRRLDAAQLDPHASGAGHAARGLFPVDQHGQRQDRRIARLRHDRRHGPPVRHFRTISRPSRRWCLEPATSA